MSKATPSKPRRYIAELKPGEIIEDQVFLIGAKDLRTTTTGSLYIHCVLRDRTGQLLGRIWQATQPMYEQMPEGGFMRFKGRVESYKGALQFIVDAMQPVDPGSVGPAEFMPQTTEDIPAMFERVKAILRTIKDPNLLGLMKEFIRDEELMAKFCKAPAAIQNHHAYLGGLLEHTRNVLELALLVVPRYPALSKDLMLAGIFLHDLGKAVELGYDTNFVYTNEGQLVGHIMQAVVWIDRKVQAVQAQSGKPFPTDLKAALAHIVLAHHGQYEFGSPKLPATLEAVAIHHLDNLDAKLNMYFNKMNADPDPASDWTQYVHGLGTKLFKKDVLGIRP